MVTGELDGNGEFLRGVDHHGHPCIAVADLCTIDPDRIRVIDCDLKNI